MTRSEKRDFVPCPSCGIVMARLNLANRMTAATAVEIDLCFVCQGLWFDAHESARIAPGAIIDLFRHIHDRRTQPRRTLAERLNCPRCEGTLQHARDIGKSGRFNYFRCQQEHGRFTPFAQFMIEKGFVRQLAPAEIAALAARVATIHCTGCGAPFDIRTDAACPYCRAPITILDPDAVSKALAGYGAADTARTLRASAMAHDPIIMADALIAAERSHAQQSRQQTNTSPDTLELGDLITTGIDIVWTIFKD